MLDPDDAPTISELSLDDEIIYRGMQTGEPLDDVVKEVFEKVFGSVDVEHPDNDLF